jgi:SAM-dependent methyltransferase/protein-tyrosine-phosphatase
VPQPNGRSLDEEAEIGSNRGAFGGVAVHGLNRVAVKVMAEQDIDISAYRSKSLSDLKNLRFDYIISLCDKSRRIPPSELDNLLSGESARVLHVAFDDPPALAVNATSEDEAIGHYRRVRDEIKAFVENLPEELDALDTATEDTEMSEESKAGEIRDKVRAGYGEIARQGGTCCCGCAPTADSVASALGYAEQDLASLPEGANMGLSCGNPTAIAALNPGEVVIDLGSGGGFDVFIAGRKVGAQGCVIGIDMTADMISKARRNCEVYRKTTGLDNVEFRLGEIEHLPVPDNTADVIISNCVINLSPDKPQVWREIARVLKPGGRCAISDLARLKPLPADIQDSVEALIGCVAGAVSIEEIQKLAENAGLRDIEITSKPGYVDAMVDWNDPMYHKIVAGLPKGAKPSDYFTSADISARKPCCRA